MNACRQIAATEKEQPEMLQIDSWEVNLRRHTAQAGGFVVRFTPHARSTFCGMDGCRDDEGTVWIGSASPNGQHIRDEMMRTRLIRDAATAYRKAMIQHAAIFRKSA